MQGTNTDNLSEEIKLALQDYFVADLSIKDGAIILNFNGNKKFKLSLEEI